MTKFAKILFLSVIAVGLLAGPAMAAILYNSQDVQFGTGGSTTNSYRIAYEIYNEALGISTISTRGGIRIDLTQPLVAGDSANLVVASGNAQFNSAGSLYKWGLWYDANADTVVDPGEIIGYTPSAGLITPNLPFSINIDVAALSTLRVLQWEDLDTNNDFTVGETIVSGAGLFVSAGLGATCDIAPLIKIGFTTPRETTPTPVNFAYITPQFGGTGPSTGTLTAELDTDTDFRFFIPGSGSFLISNFEISNPDFFTIVDNATTEMWIAYSPLSPEGTISFDVNSVVGEPAADIFFDTVSCDPNADATTFACGASGAVLVGSHSIFLDVNTVDSNEPTNWSLANVQINVTTSGLKDLCITVPTQSIGVWYGGLEAFVPFVKGSADGSYETYIALFNRYSSDAKVYVSTFKDSGPTPIMVATGQILGKEVIPVGERITITAADILAFLSAQGISWDPTEGLPVKFNIRVPSQTGTTSYTGTVALPDVSGTVTSVNPFDPFVEGIVISVYPGGQRSIPLKFKTFKQGAYGH